MASLPGAHSVGATDLSHLPMNFELASGAWNEILKTLRRNVQDFKVDWRILKNEWATRGKRFKPSSVS